MKKLVLLLFSSIILSHCTYFNDTSLNFFDKNTPPSPAHLTQVLGYKKLSIRNISKLLSKTSDSSSFPYQLGKLIGDTLITYNFDPTKKCISAKEVFIKIDSEHKMLKWIKDNGVKVENITTSKRGKAGNHTYKKLTVSNKKGEKFNCILRRKQLVILTVYDCSVQK